MLILVLANNYTMLFVGWEGVGLCSYLLIGFYFHKKSAGDAGKKAFIANRVGDAAFILGMLLTFSMFGTGRFLDVKAALAGGGFHAEAGHFSVLSAIAHPNIVYILFTLGLLGLTVEFWNPGAVLPGVAGGICLLLAFFAFQVLPVNYAGVLLILFGVMLFVLELKVASHGVKPSSPRRNNHFTSTGPSE
jgi:formate hydrogenlyase subunit 3/multisubunit Na+/H+ antiporter MnhD subunit